MSTPKRQAKVLSNIAERGYLSGYTLEQFLYRQAVKILEEACEFLLTFRCNGSPQEQRLMELTKALQHQVRLVFDDKAIWKGKDVQLKMGEAKKELTDIGVAAFCAAQAIAEIEQESFVLLHAAVEKSEEDIKRGVR